jgi:cytochrome b
MAHITDTSGSGRMGAREIRVWDPLVRLIHWALAATILVNAFSDGEGDLHMWVGFAAAGLVAIRLLWGLIGPRPARFASFPPNPAAALAHLRAMLPGQRRVGPVHLSHNPVGALMVYNLWGTVAALAATGYMMGTMRFFGIDWVEELHELAFDWLLLSIALHIAGVLFDSWRTRIPLIRAMVTGTKRLPDGTDAR